MAKDIAPLLQSPMARRLLFTTGALLVYRLGCQIPVPGLDTDGLLRLSGLLSIETVSIFALGVTPFLSALLRFRIHQADRSAALPLGSGKTRKYAAFEPLRLFRGAGDGRRSGPRRGERAARNLRPDRWAGMGNPDHHHLRRGDRPARLDRRTDHGPWTGQRILAAGDHADLGQPAGGRSWQSSNSCGWARSATMRLSPPACFWRWRPRSSS